MRIVPFDKIYSAGTYTAEDNKGYIVRRIGTDSDTGNNLEINRIIVISLKKAWAPLYESADNLLGPIDLKNVPLVILPGAEFTISPAGRIRLSGDLIILDPEEAFPTEWVTRAEQQLNRRFEIIEGEYTLSAGVTWRNREELTIYQFTNPVARRNIFSDLILAYNPDPKGISEDDIGVTIFHNGKPLDITDVRMGVFGIALSSCPLPPRSVPLLETRAQTLSGDGAAKTFSLPTEYTPLVKLIRATPEVAGVPAHVMPVDTNTIYVCKVDVTVATAADADIPMASGESIDVTFDYEKYPALPNKFSLVEHPIIQEPGDEIMIRFRNISGADYTPTATQTFKVVLFSIYERV